MATTPPVFIADNETTLGWDDALSDSHTTSTFDSAVGDIWVTGVLSESETSTFQTPTNGGTAQTFTPQGNVDTTAYGEIRTWTTTVANTLTGQGITATRTPTSDRYGVSVLRFSGSAGIGAVPAGEAETNSTAPSLTFTTTGDNSAIVVFVVDFNAADGTSRTWRTVNGITPTSGNGLETTYFRNSAQWTLYIGYYSDAGAAGSKTVGLSAPTTMKASIVAIEVLGTTTAAYAVPQQSRLPFTVPFSKPAARALQLLGDASGAQFPALLETSAGDDSATVTAAVPLTDTAAGADTATVAVAVPLADTATATDTATVAVAAPLADTAAGADAVVVTVPVSFTDTATGDDGTLTVAPAVPLPETPSGSDVLTTAAAVPLADTATGADSLSVQSDALIVVDANQAKPGFPWMLTSLRTSASQSLGDATFPGSNQNVTLTDTAAAADALTAVATVPFDDSATGTDAATLAAAVSLSDGGTGDDSLNVTVTGAIDSYQRVPGVAWMFLSPRASSQQNIGDTFSGPSALVETAAGTDSLTAVPAVPLADTATATDALTVAVTMSLPDTASGADSVAAMAAVPLDDAAAATDSLSVVVVGGSDQNQWLPPNKWGITRPGVAMDPPAMQLLGDASGSTLASVTDTATAADSLTVSVAVVMTETVAGADALASSAVVPLSDLVAATDALALSTVLALSETASAADLLAVSGSGIQGNAHGRGPHSTPGNVYPKSSGSIIGSVR